MDSGFCYLGISLSLGFQKSLLSYKFYFLFDFLLHTFGSHLIFSHYDVVISSSGWFMSKGIMTKSQRKTYLLYASSAILSVLLSNGDWGFRNILLSKYMPISSIIFSVYGILSHHKGLMFLIANSEETRRRIQKFYRRDALMDISTSWISLQKSHLSSPVDDGYYVTVSMTCLLKACWSSHKGCKYHLNLNWVKLFWRILHTLHQ